MRFKHFSLMLIACAFVSFNVHAEAEQRAEAIQRGWNFIRKQDASNKLPDMCNGGNREETTCGIIEAMFIEIQQKAEELPEKIIQFGEPNYSPISMEMIDHEIETPEVMLPVMKLLASTYANWRAIHEARDDLATAYADHGDKQTIDALTIKLAKCTEHIIDLHRVQNLASHLFVEMLPSVHVS